MPTYRYECQDCGHALELFQSMTERAKRKCPDCGKPKLQRMIGAGAGVIFKGSGFYQTDYRSTSYSAGEKAAASDAKPGPAGPADAPSGGSTSGAGTSDPGKSDRGKSDSGKAGSGGSSKPRTDTSTRPPKADPGQRKG